jgi:hypothetical protein
MFEDLESKLAAIAKRPAHWSETKIARHSGGMIGDVERFQREDQWWRRDQRGVRDLAAINELLEHVGVGRLRDDVDPTFERRRDAAKKRNESYESSTRVEEVVEAQRDDKEEAWSEYLPSPNDNMQQWYKDFATRIDVNTSERRGFFDALGSYIGKFPASAIARDLNADTLRTLVRMICEEAQ